ncbi:flagella synthesis protein FlgN [Dryocola sp. BD613]|uniref:flagella synthesis protein FlgN n=1 Tax=Dryocola sp. BD613 TaxID=3133272 RepID=UPI003F50764C
MENLQVILLKMHDSMMELEAILTEEMNQLSRAQINPVSLQIISDTKSRLLSTIGYYDEMRTQEEHRLNLAAPYKDHVPFATQWRNISEHVKISNGLNKQIARLLEMHMEKANNVKNIVNEVDSRVSTYSVDGISRQATSGKIYNISI